MITNTFPPRQFGGVTAVSHMLSKKLAERGNQVTVYTTDAGNTEHSRLEIDRVARFDGLEVHYFRNINNLLAFKYRLFTPVDCVPTFRRSIKRFDIVHFHDYRSLFSIFGSYFANGSGVPYVMQAHGSMPKALPRQKRPPIFVKYVSDALINERVIRNASKVIALNQLEAQAYQNAGVDSRKIAVIPNGLDLSQFAKLPPRGQFRKRYGIGSHEKIILFLARINKVKGLTLLLSAFGGLEKEVDDVRLIIAGHDDGYLSQVKADVKRSRMGDKVLITGRLNENVKIEAYVDADVYVLPSCYEVFGMSVIEACACGAPTIVTNGNGIADAIKEVGYVVECEHSQLQSAMFDIITNENVRERMSRKGPIMVKERYDIEKIVDDLETLYQTCL
jgi:glycosyltransferase involved in cell wall biosynthesis